MFIGTLSEGLVLDLGYMCEFMHRIQQPMTAAWLETIDQDTLMEYKDQRVLELAHTNPSEVGAGCPTFNANDTWTSLDNLKHYLGTQRGVKKVPLHYFICPNIQLPPSDTDNQDQYNDLDCKLVA